MTRNDCLARDAADPLAPHRAAFALPPGVIYLDGNSLGALPATTAARVNEVVRQEWGRGLIGSWNAAGWIDRPARVGARIAELIGAQAEEVICADSTSLNLFKVLACALRLQGQRPQLSMRERRIILSERGNFPTDLYMAQGLAEMLGGHYELQLVGFDEVPAALARLGERVAVLMLTHVNFATGAMHHMASLTELAQAKGALTVWDLAHSAGAVPVDLGAARADFAVGCGYKYLNGGPGAPAFVYVAQRHLAAMADDAFAQPLSGWLGHRAPFDFVPQYEPAPGIGRFVVGTPSILALAALECGVETVLAAGVPALRAKSVALTELFIELVESRCQESELRLASPRQPARRGSQVCFAHPQAWPVMQALIGRGVIGDFRAPDILRLRAAIAANDLPPAFKMLARVSRVMEQLVHAWNVLATMTPSEYSAIRPYLGASSGFQSWQYRAIEYILGNKNAAMLKPHAHRADIQQSLAQALAAPSLYDEALALLARRGLAIAPAVLARDVREPWTFDESVEHAWLAVYRAPREHWELYELAEELVDLEDAFRQWRFRHVTTVERIIGFKRGTGGTSGVSYLRRMLDVVLFPELWKARTDL